MSLFLHPLLLRCFDAIEQSVAFVARMRRVARLQKRVRQETVGNSLMNFIKFETGYKILKDRYLKNFLLTTELDLNYCTLIPCALGSNGIEE